MLQHPYEQILKAISRIKGEYKVLADQSNSIITSLHVELIKNENDILSEGIVDNTIRFNYWGLNFITKTEISFNEESHGFAYGELNTYHVDKEDEVLFLTFKFDNMGVFENRYMPENFTNAYYIAFIKEVMNYTQKNNIKFQLM